MQEEENQHSVLNIKRVCISLYFQHSAISQLLAKQSHMRAITIRKHLLNL